MRWSTAARPRSRSSRSGSTTSAGGSRTTAPIRRSRSTTRRRMPRRRHDRQLETALATALRDAGGHAAAQAALRPAADARARPAAAATGTGAVTPDRARSGEKKPRHCAVKTPRLLQIAPDDPAAIRAELLAGLTAPTASDVAQVPLRRARLAAVCRHHRTARVLSDAHRGGDLRDGAAGDGGGARPGARRWWIWVPATAKRPRACLPRSGCGATWRWTSRPSYLRESLENLQRQHPAIDMLGIGLDFSHGAAAAGRSRRRSAHAVLPGFEHRQLHAGGGAGLPARGPCRRARAARC